MRCCCLLYAHITLRSKYAKFTEFLLDKYGILYEEIQGCSGDSVRAGRKSKALQEFAQSDIGDQGEIGRLKKKRFAAGAGRWNSVGQLHKNFIVLEP